MTVLDKRGACEFAVACPNPFAVRRSGELTFAVGPEPCKQVYWNRADEATVADEAHEICSIVANPSPRHTTLRLVPIRIGMQECRRKHQCSDGESDKGLVLARRGSQVDGFNMLVIRFVFSLFIFVVFCFQAIRA